MKFFSKREHATQIITLMAMMAAINVIVSVIAAFSILASVFLIIILPLTSTIVVLTCPEKYFPIYAFATIGLSIVATIWNLDITLFYVVPSIISGFVFGFCIKRDIYFGWSIVISTILQTLVSFSIIPLINVLFEIDFIHDLQEIFKISNAILGQIFVCCSFYLIALIQTFLSYFVVRNEIAKFKQPSYEETNNFYFCLMGVLFSLLIFPVAFLSIGAAYVLELLSLTVAGIIIYEMFRMHLKKALVISGITLLTNVFLTAILYGLVPDYCGLLLFALTPLIICLLPFCYFLLKKEHNKIK